MSEMIYGRNPVKAAIEQKRDIEEVFFQKDASLNELIDLAKRNKIKHSFISKEAMNNKVTSNHQGVVAVVAEYKYYNIEDIIKENSLYEKEKPLIIALDSLEDPHNLGAILRICDAAGVDGVILPKNRSVRLNNTVAKVSTGAIETVKVVEVVNLVRTLKSLKEKGYWIVGASLEEKSENYWDIKYDVPIVLVIGGEGKGISNIVINECDFIAQIPMQGTVNSLNASVSTGILVYEIKRQQR